MSLLFQALELRNITLKNRIAISPMCQYSSEDGFANDWHFVHLVSRAVGGAGLIFTEAAAVSPEGRISPEDLGIWKDAHIPFLEKITKALKAQGAVAGIQLAHAGRKASTSSPWKGRKPVPPQEGGWSVVGPTALPYKAGELVPVEMDEAAIRATIANFSAAARRAIEAGFEVIEIHAAHGYLINQFLSPVSNERQDAYGGSFDNRIRLLMEIVKEVRDVIGDAVLMVRISATEWVPEGWQIDDSVALAQRLKEAGVDLIDCSSGGNAAHQQIDVKPLYQVPFAEKIKKEAGIPTGAVGLITRAEEAEGILQNAQADLILIGRESLRNPYFPLQAAAILKAPISWPNQYERAGPRKG